MKKILLFRRISNLSINIHIFFLCFFLWWFFNSIVWFYLMNWLYELSPLKLDNVLLYLFPFFSLIFYKIGWWSFDKQLYWEYDVPLQKEIAKYERMKGKTINL